MRVLHELFRRAGALWAALRRLLRKGPEAPAALAAAPPPAPAVEVSPPAPAPAEPVAARNDMSQQADVSIAEEGAGASAPGVVAPAGPAVLASAPAPLSVRQFFARVAAAAPGGLAIDFAAWQAVKVERFFMAMGAPERVQRRGPALAEEVALGRAFDGFEWD